MNIGISTGIFYDRDILLALPAIREAGYDTIEIWASPEKNGQYVHFNWNEPSKIQALDLLLRDLGLKVNSIHAPFSDAIDISHPDEAHRGQAAVTVTKTGEVLRSLGGKFLVLHPASNERSLHDRNWRFRQSRKSIEEIVRALAGSGVRLAVENQLPHILGGDAATLHALIEGLPEDGVGFCFDTSHAHLYHGRSLEQTFSDLAPRVLTLHASDNNGHTDEHRNLGEGSINWTRFAALLRTSGYKGDFVMELMFHDHQQDSMTLLRSANTRARELLKTGSPPG